MTENVLKPDKSDPAWSWLALSLISGIGSKKIWDLIEHLGSVEDLLKTSPEILIEQFQISSKLADLISKATLLELELTGTVETIGGQIYRLRVELEIPSN